MPIAYCAETTATATATGTARATVATTSKVQELRPAMLEAVAHWKELHASLSSLVFDTMQDGITSKGTHIPDIVSYLIHPV